MKVHDPALQWFTFINRIIKTDLSWQSWMFLAHDLKYKNKHLSAVVHQRDQKHEFNTTQCLMHSVHTRTRTQQNKGLIRSNQFYQVFIPREKHWRGECLIYEVWTLEISFSDASNATQIKARSFVPEVGYGLCSIALWFPAVLSSLSALLYVPLRLVAWSEITSRSHQTGRENDLQSRL